VALKVGVLLVVCAAVAACAAQPVAWSARVGISSSASALQTEFIRRVNAAEPVSALLLAAAAAPDVSGWRSIALLHEESSLPSPKAGDAASVQTKLRVKLRRQTQVRSECPVVDSLLVDTGDDLYVWDELGWLEASYERTAAGWRIARLTYLPDT
jgi:hypothetical protein